MTIEVFAPAKVNLTLHVTGQLDDGYHLLDSLVVFADIGDRLWVSEAAETSLQVTGRYAKGVPTDPSNLVWKAADLCGMTVDITLEKNLPNAAGIGGGSADAAAMIRAAKRLGCNPTGDIASLGADVPVCMANTPQRMQGIGDVLNHVGQLPDLWIVLVNPRVDVPTPAVFSKLQSKTNMPMSDHLPDWEGFAEFCEWLADQRNDLETPAIAIQPVIEEVLDTLADAGFKRMSGSGATCFGLYPSAHAASLAAERIQNEHPEWWVAGGRVLAG
jgi:4-diphosphocytidyl-2-C-methyl-D-erythritol kinase